MISKADIHERRGPIETIRTRTAQRTIGGRKTDFIDKSVLEKDDDWSWKEDR
jgi:hypothetical protein